MCIYCGTKKYRKIYENHYGPIPKDETGRTYEIHHIDGNHSNNDPDNLKCVSIQEHYDVHYSQGDWGACTRMAYRMNLSSQETAELSRRCQKELVEAGTHHWLGPESNLKRIKDGTNPFGNKEWQKEKAKKLVLEGKHNFLGGAIQSATNKKRLKNGTHPSQKKITCEFCSKTLDSANYKRYHGDNCLQNPTNAGSIRTNKCQYKIYKCEHCGIECKGKHGYTKWHGDNCRSKTN
jgi:hypothetical protein